MINATILLAIAMCFIVVITIERVGKKREIQNAKRSGYQSGYKDAAIFYYDEHMDFLNRKLKRENQKGNTP